MPNQTRFPSSGDITEDLCDRWLGMIRSLPLSSAELKAYLSTPLPDDAKVPINHNELRRLVTSGYPNITCTESDLEALFRVTGDEETPNIIAALIPAVHRLSPEKDGTAASFIHFWDDNIRNILETVISLATSVRDTTRGTRTGLCRPDFGFLIHGICTLRGEEKRSGYNGRHPRIELFNKLRWTYDPAPYVLGVFVRFEYSLH